MGFTRLQGVVDFLLRSNFFSPIKYSDLNWDNRKTDCELLQYFKSSRHRSEGSYLFCDNEHNEGLLMAFTLLRDYVNAGIDIIDDDVYSVLDIKIDFDDRYPFGLDGFLPVVSALHLDDLLEDLSKKQSINLKTRPDRQRKYLLDTRFLVINAVEMIMSEDWGGNYNRIMDFVNQRNYFGKLTILILNDSDKGNYHIRDELIDFFDRKKGLGYLDFCDRTCSKPPVKIYDRVDFDLETLEISYFKIDFARSNWGFIDYLKCNLPESVDFEKTLEIIHSGLFNFLKSSYLNKEDFKDRPVFLGKLYRMGSCLNIANDSVGDEEDCFRFLTILEADYLMDIPCEERHAGGVFVDLTNFGVVAYLLSPDKMEELKEMERIELYEKQHSEEGGVDLSLLAKFIFGFKVLGKIFAPQKKNAFVDKRKPDNGDDD